MTDISNVIVPVFMGATVNVVAKFNEHGVKGTMETVFGAAALFTTLAAMGQFLDWELASVLAWLYFVATMFTSGIPFIEWFIKLLGE